MGLCDEETLRAVPAPRRPAVPGPGSPLRSCQLSVASKTRTRTETSPELGTGNSETGNREVRPGGQAPLPFRSVPEAVSDMSDGDQIHLVGPMCWMIRQVGLVTWYDLFDSNGDPREFDQVIKRKGLTVDQLVKAGVAEGVARRAVGLGAMEEGVGDSRPG